MNASKSDLLENLRFPGNVVDRLRSHGATDRCLICEDDTAELRSVQVPVGPNWKSRVDLIVCGACQADLSRLDDVFPTVIEQLATSTSLRSIFYGARLKFEMPTNAPLRPGTLLLLKDARRAFFFGLYAACVVTASSAVERVINHEIDPEVVLAEGMNPDRWLRLNLETLRLAHSAGFPVYTLLQEPDELDAAQYGNDVAFLKRRNKFAHGELNADLVASTMYDLRPIVHDAFVQLARSQEFIIQTAHGGPKAEDARPGWTPVKMEASFLSLNKPLPLERMWSE